MFDKILKLLVDHINQKLRRAKTALETEEKARDIATHQGNIIGWKKLLNYLAEIFFLYELHHPADSEEELPMIEGIETQVIDDLFAQKELLITSSEWESLLKKVEGNKEFLKESLITTADSARDLYLAQAQQEGITEFKTLFEKLSTEHMNRKEELNFNSENTAEETTKEIPIE